MVVAVYFLLFLLLNTNSYKGQRKVLKSPYLLIVVPRSDGPHFLPVAILLRVGNFILITTISHELGMIFDFEMAEIFGDDFLILKWLKSFGLRFLFPLPLPRKKNWNHNSSPINTVFCSWTKQTLYLRGILEPQRKNIQGVLLVSLDSLIVRGILGS